MTRIVRVAAAVFACAWAVGVYSSTSVTGSAPTEAPTGFDGKSNGLVLQSTFDADRATFEERDDAAKGLGPVYNAQSCAECHQTPVTGGISQVAELRAGTFLNGVFTDHPGGSLVNDRAIDPRIQEHVSDADNVRTLRTTLNALGDGFVEAIDDATFSAIRAAQPSALRGTIISVPVAEAGGALRVGRFGWKNQNASLLSFAGDAYLNEQGITNRLFPVENTSEGRFVGFGSGFDLVPDDPAFGEDPDGDIDAFAEFMRATKAPSRGSMTTTAAAGAAVFSAIGCSTCHTPTIVTAPVGTIVNGGQLTVPDALGNKIIHPFGDFMLHDVGTGDGIVQNGGAGTRNKMRTPPLWGVRTRSRLMHDGASLTFEDAILRHGGQATPVTQLFKGLSAANKARLLAFLASL
ncbi:MAG TPA: di-heme oxidoredictase family protein [Vicinamibacterales bacterium]|nr:di-heme oxidoredictase family protein [Vicinamibacterales bacterium]